MLTALEEPPGGLDPRPGDGVGVRGSPGDLQRRQLFGQDLAVDAARSGAQEPTAGQENQREAGLCQPTVWSVGVPPEDTEGTRKQVPPKEAGFAKRMALRQGRDELGFPGDRRGKPSAERDVDGLIPKTV